MKSPSNVTLRNITATERAVVPILGVPANNRSSLPIGGPREDSLAKGVGVESHEAIVPPLAGANHNESLPVLVIAKKSATIESRRRLMQSLDWRLSNSQLAPLCGLTPNAVCWWRRKLGYTNYQYGWHRSC